MREQLDGENFAAIRVAQPDIAGGDRGSIALQFIDLCDNGGELGEEPSVCLGNRTIDGFSGRRPSRQFDEFADDAGVRAKLAVLSLDNREVAVATGKVGVGPVSFVYTRQNRFLQYFRLRDRLRRGARPAVRGASC